MMIYRVQFLDGNYKDFSDASAGVAYVAELIAESVSGYELQLVSDGRIITQDAYHAGADL